MERVLLDGNKLPHCPKCGKKQPAPDNRWCYGSPIKQCPECGMEYFDERYREIAISGYIPGALSLKKAVKTAAVGAVFVLLAVLMYFYETRTSGRYHVILIVIGIAGAAIILLGLIDFFEIFSGVKQKKLERFKAESEERLKNSEYVEKLAELGVDLSNVRN